MQTIIIVLNPGKMENTDLDIRYALPERIEEMTGGLVKDNGYDYLVNNDLGIWLETEDSEKYVEDVISLIKSERILENDLSMACEIYISAGECEEIDKCRRIYPV